GGGDTRGRPEERGGHRRPDQPPQPPRQHGRAAAGADRHHHLAAIDDGRKNEGRQLRPVDDVNRDALRAGARGYGRVAGIADGGDDRDHVGEIGPQRISDADLEPALAGKRQYLFRDIGIAGEPAHVRAGRAQQTKLGKRRRARSDQHDDARGGIQEHRQETHRAQSPSKSSNGELFLYRGSNRGAKRKILSLMWNNRGKLLLSAVVQKENESSRGWHGSRHARRRAPRWPIL